MSHLQPIPRLFIPEQSFACGEVYELGGTKYRIYARDYKVLSGYERICADMPSEPSSTWLLPHRKVIRFIQMRQPAAVLSLLAISRRDPEYCKLALWLRGFCCSKVGSRELLELAVQNDAEIQLAVAATLYRIGAWAQLRMLLEETGLGEEEIGQKLSRQRREFAESLREFLKNVRSLEISEKHRPVFVSDSTPKTGKSAKPKWLIRLVLDRVRLLVSAKQS
ncbi:MAG: hypothetical protein AAF483_18195, partial [Planctomycetota bacterium]